MWSRLATATRVSLLLLLVGSAVDEAWAQEARYSAVLGPAAGNPGSGRAELSFDDLGRQLTYTIVYDAMPGNVLSAYIAGPQQADVTTQIEVPPGPSPAPVVGTATLAEIEANLLKAGKLFVGLRSSANGDIAGLIVPK